MRKQSSPPAACFRPPYDCNRFAHRKPIVRALGEGGVRAWITHGQRMKHAPETSKEKHHNTTDVISRCREPSPAAAPETVPSTRISKMLGPVARAECVPTLLRQGLQIGKDRISKPGQLNAAGAACILEDMLLSPSAPVAMAPAKVCTGLGRCRPAHGA